MKYGVLLLLFMFVGILCVQCNGVGFLPRGVRGADRIADDIDELNEDAVPVCKGANCCGDDRECVRICHSLFRPGVIRSNVVRDQDINMANSSRYRNITTAERYDKKYESRCKVLPRSVVLSMEALIQSLSTPVLEDLRWLDVTQEFRLLLAIDPVVLIRLVKSYTMDNARDLLYWFAESQFVPIELLKIPKELRNELLYELLASAGDRRLNIGPVEAGLASAVSFNGETFFQLLMRYSNVKMLNIVHTMMRDDMCGYNYGVGDETELCILRLYCREHKDMDNQYVHPEETRNWITFRLDDPKLLQYMKVNIYGSGIDNQNLSRSLLTDEMCQMICLDSGKRGCEGWSVR